MKKIIYISHPYNNEDTNIKEIEQIVSDLYSIDELYRNFIFISPVHCFGFMYNSVAYYKGLNFCLDLLEISDCMLVFGDYNNSTGCKAEIQYCKDHKINHAIISNIEDIKDTEFIHLLKTLTELE